MVWDWIAGNWKRLIGLMQEKWGKLTHNELVTAAGQREQLVGLLQKHYGYAKDQAEIELDNFTRLHSSEMDTDILESVPLLRP